MMHGNTKLKKTLVWITVNEKFISSFAKKKYIIVNIFSKEVSICSQCCLLTSLVSHLDKTLLLVAVVIHHPSGERLVLELSVADLY